MELINIDQPIKALTKPRYDFTLAEFPFCLLDSRLEVKKGADGSEYWEYKDAIKGKDGKPVERTWRIHPDSEARFGGRTTTSTIFELFQVWKEQGFDSRNIRFGTINNILQRKGVQRSTRAYKAIMRDLLYMVGAQYDAFNAFWDNEKKAYVSIKRFKFFDFVSFYDKTPKAGQQALPFGYIRASEILQNAMQTGNLSLDFDRKLFHKLSPLQQRLALYGSKAIRSQAIIKRDLETFASQMTITAKQTFKIRQEFKKAVLGMKAKGVDIFDRVEFEKSSDRQRENIILYSLGQPDLPFKEGRGLISEREQARFDLMAEDILAVCEDNKSLQFYKMVAQMMPESDIYQALSEVKETGRSGAISKSKGALFTSIIKRYAKERNIDL